MVLKVAAGVFVGLLLFAVALVAVGVVWQATGPQRERQACIAKGGVWTQFPTGYICTSR